MLPSIPSFLSGLFAGIVATGIFGVWAFPTWALDHASYSLDVSSVEEQAQFEGSGSWT